MTSPARATSHVYEDLVLQSGTHLRWALVLPETLDPEKTYPVLLALPPGPQTEAMVEAGMSRYWGKEAKKRGWIVASPVAPAGQLFFQGAEVVIPELLDHLAGRFHVAGGRFHLAGSSNGGLAAFRVAVENPGRFATLTVLPGGPPSSRDFERLDRLEGVVIHMFAGGDDTRWVELMRQAETRLKELGIPVETKVFPGEGHVPSSLDGAPIMKLLDRLREAP